MDPEFDDVVAVEDLMALERRYAAERQQGALSRQCRFEYGWGLVRSRYREDTARGVALLSGVRARPGAPGAPPGGRAAERAGAAAAEPRPEPPEEGRAGGRGHRRGRGHGRGRAAGRGHLSRPALTTPPRGGACAVTPRRLRQGAAE
ncbi:mitochondrial fission 1 protein isoform X3 [Haemorhous mexicanus]|uniref:mitochondrial fission 1 protein isoform X3 n=1 Tax=Haemorhous mexicanus TaxID=30427 RepID=UPI0028BE2F67|nr:mitochondrial fission 1 protein isoform X3 [Haemorhous mexicanus]